MKRNKLIEWFWKIHPRLYRWSKGRIGNRIMNFPVLLLTTTGRKSGLSRTKALMYLPHGDDYVVIASNLGELRHPLWWLNLQADPHATVEIEGRQFPVLAHEAEEEEREALWQDIFTRGLVYAEYQARTTRRIPVVVLTPA